MGRADVVIERGGGGFALKFAVTNSGPVIVKFCGLELPREAPVAPVNPANWYAVADVAVTVAVWPLLIHSLAGLIDPPAEAAVVS